MEKQTNIVNELYYRPILKTFTPRKLKIFKAIIKKYSNTKSKEGKK